MISTLIDNYHQAVRSADRRKAGRIARRAYRVDPCHDLSQCMLAESLTIAGKHRAALTILERSPPAGGPSVWRLMLLMESAGRSGRLDTLTMALQELLRRHRHDHRICLLALGKVWDSAPAPLLAHLVGQIQANAANLDAADATELGSRTAFIRKSLSLLMLAEGAPMAGSSPDARVSVPIHTAQRTVPVVLDRLDFCTLYYSGSYKAGVVLTDAQLRPTAAGSASWTRPELAPLLALDSIDIDDVDRGENGENNHFLCGDRFTYGNMYHTGIVHVVWAMACCQLAHPSDTLLFYGEAWPWAKLIIERTFGSARIRYLQADRIHRIRRLYSLPLETQSLLHRERDLWGFHLGFIRRIACDLAQDAPQLVGGIPSHVYISRKLASARAVANEAQLEELFSEHGFSIVMFEELDPRQQMSLVKHASHIAGVHGAAFSNLLVADPECLIVEIGEAVDTRRCYQILTSSLSIRRHHLIPAIQACKGVLTVDVDQVRAALAGLI
ncbi:glycosyltransferase family 61 protein [Synechococcus sp. J7-Johnson]|uniref:glycosyltransferase family 61 protein n=1 Tax=Synechococcus sp. J7-Johnson TaxID=2823737 RepID=UPI0020CC90E7|nr:glycosyltransferase family 61 protein [Synechococcus sp. J7-Johnson]MCP9839610.1 glycosyltransferase family 61 protein [Synechococcus sp. J7-Johnson]